MYIYGQRDCVATTSLPIAPAAIPRGNGVNLKRFGKAIYYTEQSSLVLSNRVITKQSSQNKYVVICIASQGFHLNPFSCEIRVLVWSVGCAHALCNWMACEAFSAFNL